MKTIITSVLTILLILTITNKTKAQAGAALNFDGVNDQVRIPGSTMGAFSIEFWMRTTQTGLNVGSNWNDATGLVDSEVTGAFNNDYGVALRGSKIVFGVGNPVVNLNSISNVNTGAWFHVAAVWTSNPSGQMFLYINGVLEASQTSGVSNGTRNTNANLAIGSIQTNVGYYNGDIDEVRLWNYTLSQCEILSRMNCELTLPQTGLLRYYNCNQGLAAANNTTITSLTNLLGSNNATITGMALTGNTSNFIGPGAIVSGISCNPLSLNVQGNGNNVVDGTTTTTTLNATNFGTVCSSPTPSTSVFTIQNNGTSSVTLNTFTITGANANSFSLTSIPPTSLAAGSTATFAVTFSATSAGVKTAMLAFNSSNCAFPIYNYAIGASVISAPTIAVNSGSICSGTSFVIVPSGALSYTFSGGTATVSPSSTTIYTVVGTGTNGCPGTNSAISTVSVTITPTINLSGSTICSSQSFTLLPSGATSYTFLNGGPIVTPTVTTTYSVTGANGSCLSTNTAVATISVNTTPTVAISAANPTACAGASNTLTASGAVSYTFNPGNILSNTAIVSPTVTSIYSVTGSNGNCSDTKTINLIVSPLPTISIIGSNSLCAGSSLTLTAGGGNTYLWNTSATTNSIVVTPSLTTTYSVVGTNTNGCQNFAIKTLTVNASPTISINSGTICAGNTFTLTPSGANSYTFINGGPLVTPTINSSYSVIGTNSAGCVSSNTAVSTVSVSPLPTISIVSSNTLICVGQTATLSASGASNYTWSIGMSSPVIIVSPTTTTNYSVIATSAFGCSNSASFNQSVSPCTSIQLNESNNSAALTLYPNPTKDKITLATINIFEPIFVTIYDVTGKECIKHVFENKTEVNVEQLKPGLYFISSSTGNLKTKFIKQ